MRAMVRHAPHALDVFQGNSQSSQLFTAIGDKDESKAIQLLDQEGIDIEGRGPHVRSILSTLPVSFPLRHPSRLLHASVC